MTCFLRDDELAGRFRGQLRKWFLPGYQQRSAASGRKDQVFWQAPGYLGSR